MVVTFPGVMGWHSNDVIDTASSTLTSDASGSGTYCNQQWFQLAWSDAFAAE